MKKDLKMLVAKLCSAAIILTSVFPGAVPVMAQSQADELMVYENGSAVDVTEDVSILNEDDTAYLGEDTPSLISEEPIESNSEDGDILITPDEGISGELAEDLVTEDTDMISGIPADVSENAVDQPDMTIHEGESPEQFLDRVMGAEGVEPAEMVSQNVADDDFGVVRYADRITVSNNQPTVSGNENDLYAVAVLSSNIADVKQVFWATRIRPGSTVSIYQAYDSNGRQPLISSAEDYMVWIGRGFTWTDEKGEEHIEDFGIIGYQPEYDENDEPKKDEQGNIIYYKYNILNQACAGRNDIRPDSVSPWQDGYSKIKFKAVVQKNMTIKLSWTPSSKDELQKTFKKYALFELTEDKSNPTGYKETQRWPMKKDGTPNNPSGSKSATLKPGFISDSNHMVNSSMIYLLKCYDKDGNVKAQYATAAAPYFLQMLSGDRNGEFEFRFTQNRDSNTMYYRLELAERKAEATVKNPNGFHEAWSEDYSAKYLSDYSIGDYTITAKNKPLAVSMTYSKAQPSVTLGKAYYGRMRTIARLGNLRVTSAPSNILSVKSGPDRCQVLDMAGIIYDKKDAKSNRNAMNIKRASEHINAFFEGTEVLSADSVYIHRGNTSVDLKSGMIFFIGVDDESNIKSYDLMRSVSENGPYKRIKNYPLTSTLLLKLNLKDEYLKGRNVYAMQYTSFPMEKDFFYTVRAVTRKGGVPGGYYNGEHNRTDMDLVQDFSTAEGDLTKIGLSWEHDDCVKQYWIYRSDTEFTDMTKAPVNEKGKPCPIAKVSGSKFKKIVYDDDGVNTEIRYHIYFDKKVQTDKKYYYFVRPVYNTTKATKDRTYNMDKCSPQVMGRASAAFAIVKPFSAANYATNSMKITFKQLKANNENKEPINTKYRIYRLKVSANDKKLPESMKPDVFSEMKPGQTYEQFEEMINSWNDAKWTEFFGKKNWEYVDIYNGKGISTKTVSLYDNNVQVGQYYYYLIQFATDESAGQLFNYTARVRNVPLPVENVKAEYSGSGSGIKISWSRNGRDSGKAGLVTQISTDGGNSWKNVGNSTSYTDDSLPRGNERTYKIRVAYTGTSPYVCSNESSITASLPNRIELSTSEITLNLRDHQYDSFTAKAVREGGGSASIGKIEMSCNNNDRLELAQDGNTGKLKAKQAGTVYITVRCAGISREVKVNIVP